MSSGSNKSWAIIREGNPRARAQGIAVAGNRVVVFRAIRCGIGGVETGTTLGEKERGITAGVRSGLAGTLGDGTTRRVVEVVAGTGKTVGVMEVVKRRERSVRARIVSSPTV